MSSTVRREALLKPDGSARAGCVYTLAVRPRLALAVAVYLACAACESGAAQRPLRRFIVVEAPETDAQTLLVESASAPDARALLLTAFGALPGAPNLVGRAPWATVAVLRAHEPDTDAPTTTRTFVRLGPGALQLDVRLAAGDRGAYAGGTFDSGLDRAMAEIRVEDPGTLGARFRLAIYADERAGGAPPRDVTPRYLRATLPAGRYRAGLAVPARGARWLVGAVVVDREGNAIGHGWASAIQLRRAWL